MGLVGCCLHIWHQVEVPFLISPSGSWVMGAGGRVILICLLRYQWAHRPVSTACMFTNLLVYNKSITEWLGVGIIKDRSHNLCNTSFSKSTQINAQRTSEQHACCKKVVLKKKKKKGSVTGPPAPQAVRTPPLNSLYTEIWSYHSKQSSPNSWRRTV